DEASPPALRLSRALSQLPPRHRHVGVILQIPPPPAARVVAHVARKRDHRSCLRPLHVRDEWVEGDWLCGYLSDHGCRSPTTCPRIGSGSRRPAGVRPLRRFAPVPASWRSAPAVQSSTIRAPERTDAGGALRQ